MKDAYTFDVDRAGSIKPFWISATLTRGLFALRH
jgi:hypothetical protein